MAELRYSTSIGARPTPSPRKRDDVTSPLSSDTHPDGGRDRRDRFRSLFSNHFQLLDDTARVYTNNFEIFLLFVAILAFAALFTVYSVISRLNGPYLCMKEGIKLHCPRAKEPPSLWENPLSATTSWKPCAEKRIGAISDLPEANETNGHIFIHAEGGLNQQRIAAKTGKIHLKLHHQSSSSTSSIGNCNCIEIKAMICLLNRKAFISKWYPSRWWCKSEDIYDGFRNTLPESNTTASRVNSLGCRHMVPNGALV